jgi:hypothetical protein
MTINISLILLATCRMWRIKVGYNTALNGAGPSLSRLTDWLGCVTSDRPTLYANTRPAHQQPTLFSFLLSQQIILIYVVGRAASSVQMRSFIPERCPSERSYMMQLACDMQVCQVGSHTKFIYVHEKCAPGS